MGFPPSNRILNSKEKKVLLAALREQFGVEELPVGVFVQNSKDKVMLLTRDVERVEVDELFVDSLGLYLGVWQRDGFRLSIEGSQLFEPLATKNFYELDKGWRAAWLKGEDLPYEGDEHSFVIVRCDGNVLGCGKLRAAQDERAGVILNYTPKARRLVVVNE